MKLLPGLSALPYVLILLAPIGLFYAWFQYSERLRKDALPVRNRFTLISLSLISLAVVLWVPMFILLPGNHSAGVHYADMWLDGVLPVCGIAFILSLAGRPKLIAPIAFACLGTALFWLASVPD